MLDKCVKASFYSKSKSLFVKCTIQPRVVLGCEILWTMQATTTQWWFWPFLHTQADHFQPQKKKWSPKWIDRKTPVWKKDPKPLIVPVSSIVSCVFIGRMVCRELRGGGQHDPPDRRVGPGRGGLPGARLLPGKQEDRQEEDQEEGQEGEHWLRGWSCWGASRTTPCSDPGSKKKNQNNNIQYNRYLPFLKKKKIIYIFLCKWSDAIWIIMSSIIGYGFNPQCQNPACRHYWANQRLDACIRGHFIWIKVSPPMLNSISSVHSVFCGSFSIVSLLLFWWLVCLFVARLRRSRSMDTRMQCWTYPGTS